VHQAQTLANGIIRLKLIADVTAKPGMSRGDFIEYYESNHVPLVKQLLPSIGEYRRSYVIPGLVRNGPTMTRSRNFCLKITPH
jgi:hypothetical protein